jgi:hypothetical protein
VTQGASANLKKTQPQQHPHDSTITNPFRLVKFSPAASACTT